MYTACAGSVEQHDTLWPFFTTYDHLWYAVDLCQPGLSVAEQQALIGRLLSELGLESCANTRAGNALIKGLSGGQKRRLSLGLALAKRPSIIMLDEPTSGLDAAGAAAIMKMMQKVAIDLNAAVLCTIHQPSAKVFEGFDKTLILSGGRLAYVGPASEMATYLGSIGLPVPPATNPADFMLDVVNKDFVSEEEVEKVLSKWKSAAPPADDIAMAVTGHTRSVPGQILSLGFKHGVLAFKDPTMYISRIFIAIGLTIFLNIIFIYSRDRKQDQVLPKIFMCFFLVGNLALLGIIATFGHNMSMPIVRRDVKDGVYSTTAYSIAVSIYQLPFMLLICVNALWITYLMNNVIWRSFMLVWLMASLFMFSFERIAMLVALNPSVLLAIFNFQNVWFTSFLFSGFFMQPKDIIWPIRIMSYTNTYRYALQSIIREFMIDFTDYQGSMPCTPTSDYCTPHPTGDFTCDGSRPQIACFGYNGAQLLDSVGDSYGLMTSKDSYWANVGWVLLITACYILLYIMQACPPHVITSCCQSPHGHMLCVISNRHILRVTPSPPHSVCVDPPSRGSSSCLLLSATIQTRPSSPSSNHLPRK